VEEFEAAKRDALIAGALVAVIACLLALWTSGLLIALGLVLMAVGVLISLTVIGAIIGIPLVFVGLLGFMAGIVSGSGGIGFAVLFGAGIGFVYYRFRMRAIARDYGAPRARRLLR
jgi:hypothetical protein